MIKFLKKSKLFFVFIIFVNTSSFISFEQPPLGQDQVIFTKDNIIEQLFNEDGTLSYDAIITLIEKVEDGTLIDVCSEKEWYKINNFIIFLLMQGSRPYTIEKKILEKDVRKFLHEDLYAFQIRSVHYKNWLKKQCDKTRKFIEKHKEAIIIGALVVVAVVAVAATVIAVTAAPPIAAIALNFDTPESELSKHDSAAIRNSPQTLEDTINDYQNSINENDFYENNEKIMESALFQKDIYEFPIDTYDKIIAQEHIKTNDDIYNYRAPFFIDKSNASESFYYLQGHEDLKGNYYDKAIYNFDKALELNPNNHDLYLDRAFAYLKASEFNKSLDDYHAYIEQKDFPAPKATFLNDSIDFGVGMTSSLVKGSIESGKQLVCFASDFIAHPIDTSCNIYESFSILSELAYSGEWEALSEAIVPEVCQLINEWKFLSAKEKGEKTGYIVGKYGSDVLLPSAVGKVLHKSVNSAKELITVAKNFKKAETMLAFEGASIASVRADEIANVMSKFRTAEEFFPHSSGVLSEIKNVSNITTKTDVLKVIKPNGEWIGKAGTNERIRLFKGGANEGSQVFKELTKEGKIFHQDIEKIIYKLSDETYITYREISKSGPPTIDINVEGIENNIKLKFLEGK